MNRWQSGNGVTIETPDDVVAREQAPVRGRGARRRGEATDVLSSVLADAGMLATTVELQQPRGGARRRKRGESGETSVAVTVAADEDAVLLVEGEGGVYTWITPEETAAGPQRRRRGPAVRTFRFGGGAAPAGSKRLRGPITDWFVDKLIEPVRVYALRFVVGATLDFALDKLEGDFKEGLLSLHGKDPKTWIPGAPLPKAPTKEGARILLMVHGTFSSTAGSYGQLTTHPEGKAFLEAARSQYDAVLGFDHRSLGKTPEENATEMLAALEKWGLPKKAHIDAVAFSRGGLVYRWFAEDLLAKKRKDVTLGNAVFVGCTNAGTHLAEPANWKALVDVVTNLTMAGSRAILGMTGGAALAPIVTECIKTLGRFVEMLPQLAITESRIPGLAEMQPKGATVKKLNGASGDADRLAVYYAASSNFVATLEPKKGLTKELVELLLDGVTNGLFRIDNDLVVDTASMSNFGKRKPRFEAGGHHDFGATDTVYHTIYFAEPTTATLLEGWLLQRPKRASRPKSAPKSAPRSAPKSAPAKKAPGRGATERRPSRTPRGGRSGSVRLPGLGSTLDFPRLDGGRVKPFSLDGGDGPVVGMTPMPMRAPRKGAPAKRAPARKGPAKKKTAAAAAPPAAPAGSARRSAPKKSAPKKSAPKRAAATEPEASRLCHFAAEMEPYPRLEATIPVVVTVSADKIRIAQHAAAKTTAEGVEVDPAQDITWEIVAQRNCVVEGDARLDVAVPARGRTIRETFFLKGAKAGAAQVIVEARQGMNRLVQFTLTPTFVDSKVKALKVSQSVALDAPRSGIEETAVLRVYEISRSDYVSLHFSLDCRNPNISIFEKRDLASRAELQGYVSDLYKRVESMWAGTKPTYAQFIDALEASGKTLARQLLPPAIHAALWTHRDSIAAIQVISDEPVIPWELLYVIDPASGGKSRGFLCEWGMVRWLHNAPWPLQRLQLRKDRTRCVVPDYVDSRMKLAGAKKERATLKKLFKGIEDAPVESVALGRFLSEAEKCDLLHFACHGEALELGTIDAELQLAGREEDGRIIPDSINGDQVRTRARFGADGDRPLVFINACQSGRPGTRLIQGVGGLIEAFIRPDSRRGAGAAVGTLWSIDDTLALSFAETFYGRLLAGDTLIAAAQAAREAAKSSEEMTWLAYSIYGDPFATLGG